MKRASCRQNRCAKGAMPWSEEYPESHVRQQNAPRGAAEELGDLLEHRIGNWASLFVMGNQCSGPNRAYLRHLAFSGLSCA